MTYVDELESDFSVFHGLDIWSVSFARLARLAPRLPAYQGALRLAMDRDAERLTLSPSEGPLPDWSGSAVGDDTPDQVVAQLQQRAMLSQFQEMGVEVTGVDAISDNAMEDLING